ncbi:MAG: hypothetical protein K6U00_02200 [Armatimonadetes bacterium]|nr:hypothetical protein [Armatimonadota bacterium]
MWKQLTQKARKAIFLAQEEAGRLGYSHVGPEHLLLALSREEDCVASRILEGLGLDPGTLRVELMQHLERGQEPLGDEMQLTNEAKAVIDMAFVEAQQANQDWVGTEHLLIGLSGQAKTVASQVLSKLGASVSGIRDQLRQLQAGTLPFEHVNAGGSGTISIL